MVGTSSVPTPSGAARRAGAVKDAGGTAKRRTPWRASLTVPSTVATRLLSPARGCPTTGEATGILATGLGGGDPPNESPSEGGVIRRTGGG